MHNAVWNFHYLFLSFLDNFLKFCLRRFSRRFFFLRWFKEVLFFFSHWMQKNFWYISKIYLIEINKFFRHGSWSKNTAANGFTIHIFFQNVMQLKFEMICCPTNFFLRRSSPERVHFYISSSPPQKKKKKKKRTEKEKK